MAFPFQPTRRAQVEIRRRLGVLLLLLARSDGARRRVHVQASVLIMEVMV